MVHVLFLDVVSFSRRVLHKQTAIVKALNEIVKDVRLRLSPLLPQDRLLFIPTGDGMAIAFLQYLGQLEVEQPVNWAWAIAFGLRQYNQQHPANSFEIRTGINSQEVEITTDPYGKPNIAGPGINMAQRVMDCGDAKHILASENYFELLSNFSDKFRSLSDGSIALPVKHRTINVHNLCGTLNIDGEDIEAGLTDPPRPKPKIDDLPEDLQGSVLSMVNIVKRSGSTPAALALCFARAHRERLQAIEHMHPIKGQTPVWNAVDHILRQYQEKKNGHFTHLEMISLISPLDWASTFWLDYQARILIIASSPPAHTRRLHVIEKSDVGSCLDELIPLLIAEHICSVRSRVLVVDRTQLTPVSDDRNFDAGFRWEDFVLIDGGTYQRDGGVYNVIISDIPPYFIRRTPDFSIYEVPQSDEVRYIHDELRANFFRCWHNRVANRVLTLSQIISNAGTVKTVVEEINPVSIRKYLPQVATVKLTENWEMELRYALLTALNSSTDDRDKEDHLIEMLPRLRAL